MSVVSGGYFFIAFFLSSFSTSLLYDWINSRFR